MKTAYILLPPFKDPSLAPFVSEYCASFMQRQLADAGIYRFERADITTAALQNVLPRGVDVVTVIHTSVIAWISSLRQLNLVFKHENMEIAAPLLQNGSDEQKPLLPFPYCDELTFGEVSDEIVSRNEGCVRAADNISNEIFSCTASFINKLPPDIAVSEWTLSPLWLKTPKFVAESCIAHSFADYHTHEREDLIRLIPQHVRSILDVGCAQGASGRRIKQSFPGVKLYGVEIDAHAAAHAAEVYDRVWVMPAEQFEFTESPECIICGDILEHLKDPWMFLKKLYAMLHPGGVLIGSVPNAGHWTVIEGLMNGRFDYIPAGILCRDHLRFFTKNTVAELLTGAGFHISYMGEVRSALTPGGENFVRSLETINLGDTSSLTTEQFLFRAEK